MCQKQWDTKVRKLLSNERVVPAITAPGNCAPVLGSVLDLTRIVQQESLLWAEPKPQLTEKAIASRLRTLPAELFWRVLFDLLPLMQKRRQERKRPLPPKSLGQVNSTPTFWSVMAQRSTPSYVKLVSCQKQS